MAQKRGGEIESFFRRPDMGYAVYLVYGPNAGLAHERARQLLTRVRQAFLDDRNPYEAALATLDLVVSHLGEGNTAEVRVLADEMVAVFRAHSVPREALAAVLLFQEAAHREAVTAELAREVAASITRARRVAPKP